MIETQGTYTDIKLEVPYASQHLDIGNFDERYRACGLTSAYMALRYYEAGIGTLDDLIDDGLANKGLVPAGWRHDYLVGLFERHGISCTREENMTMAEGARRFREAIESGNPVLVSTEFNRWGENDRLFHIVLLTGIRLSMAKDVMGYFFHEPNRRKRGEGEHLFVPAEIFPQGWRRMAIFPKK